MLLRYLWGIGAVVLWGAAPIALKDLTGNASGGLIATLIYAITALISLPWLLRALRQGGVNARTWALLVVAGILLTSAFNLLAALAAPAIKGSTIGAIVALEPIMVALLAALVGRRWPSRGVALSLALSVVGVWVLIGLQGGGERWAMALVLLGAVLWSASVVLTAQLRTPWPPLTHAMVIICCGSLPFLLAAPWLNGWDSLPRTTPYLSGIAFMALGVTLLANLLWLRSLQRLGALANGLLINLCPLVTFALAVLWLNEPWGARQLLGGTLIVTGLMLGAYLQYRSTAASR